MGLEQGIKMILTSKSVKAKQAKAIGLASAVVPPDQLLATAHTHALEMARGERKREQALQKKDKLPPKPMVPYAFHMAKEQIQAKAPHLQHPVFCLDAMQAGIQHGGEAGLAAEAEAFAKSAALPQHKVRNEGRKEGPVADADSLSLSLSAPPLSPPPPLPQCRRW